MTFDGTASAIVGAGLGVIVFGTAVGVTVIVPAPSSVIVWVGAATVPVLPPVVTATVSAWSGAESAIAAPPPEPRSTVLSVIVTLVDGPTAMPVCDEFEVPVMWLLVIVTSDDGSVSPTVTSFGALSSEIVKPSTTIAPATLPTDTVPVIVAPSPCSVSGVPIVTSSA